MLGNRPVPRDVALGAVSALLGVGFIIGAMAIKPDPSAFTVLGPRVAPLVIGTVTVILSVAVIVQGLRVGTRRPEDDAPGDPVDVAGPEAAQPPGSMRRRVLMTFGLLAGYILVFIPLGYIVSTFAFLTALTTSIEPEKWLRNALFGGFFTVAVYLLFTRGLQVQLPPGLLG